MAKEYIERYPVLGRIWDMGPKEQPLFNSVRELPVVEIVGRKHGKWLRFHNDGICSICNHREPNPHHFCPECGSDMREIKKTNADRIREMSNEELYEVMNMGIQNLIGKSMVCGKEGCTRDCGDCLWEWLLAECGGQDDGTA